MLRQMDRAVGRSRFKLATSESLLLDVIRVSAAVMVVVGHMTQPFFSTHWHSLMPLAKDSVAVFFVLSGFVIRYVTCLRSTTLVGYFDDRASRIYSVVIPALLFALAADAISSKANPEFYAFWAPDATHPFWRILAASSFTAQWWTLDIKPLSDSPFWSLSYEVSYYALYGCWFYLRGARKWLSVLVISLLIGPKILLLLPVWVLGCIAHDLYRNWCDEGTAAKKVNYVFAGMLAILTPVVVLFAASRNLRHTGSSFNHYLFVESQRLKLGMTGAAIGFYAWGFVATVVIVRLLAFARKISIDPENRRAGAVRFIAEGTFPIYLLHFPMLVLIAAVVPYNHASSIQKCLIILGVTVVGVLAGHPCNLLKLKLRGMFKQLAQPRVTFRRTLSNWNRTPS